MYTKASYSKGFQKKGPKCYHCEAEIEIANNSDLNIVSKGTATINFVVEDEQKLIPANEVMYATDAAVNLVSIRTIVRNGHKVIFDNTGAKIINSMNKTEATGSETNGIHQLDTQPIENEVPSCVGQTSSNLWHRKYIETTKEISAVLPIEHEDEEEQDQGNDGLPDEQTNSNSDDSNKDINEENDETMEIEEPRITKTGREVCKSKHFDDYEIYAAYDVLESENNPQTYKEAYKSEKWQKTM
ncbi:hypothetical protein JTB14_018585 [Gonioctena quinquepunctata]|nr:hypothetical protein JTB14_018585 [Gonioctena quinquepunctata]